VTATDEAGSWLVDPTRRHQYRWFDNGEWTDQVSDHGVRTVDPYGTEPTAASARAAARETTSTAAIATGGSNTFGVVAAIGGAIALMGVAVNMITVDAGVFENSLTYFDRDHGKVVAAVAGFGIIVALAGLLRSSPGWLARLLVFAAGATVTGFAIYDRVQLDHDTSHVRSTIAHNPLAAHVEVRVGIGLYLVMGGGVVMAICALLAGRNSN
jgi:hypothetical protein